MLMNEQEEISTSCVSADENTPYTKNRASGVQTRGCTDIRSRKDIWPHKILWTSGDVEHTEVLCKERGLQISMVPKEPFVMRAGKEKCAVLIDFGCEIHGSLRLQVWSETKGIGSRLRIRFGESAMEAMSEQGGRTNATNDHARRDLITEVGMMSMNVIGETGFRFVRIDLEDTDTMVLFKSITAVLVYKDVPYIGSFSCSDPLLDKIWDTGAYTVHLNMQEYVWDGIKRDRLVWVGDMHTEMKTIGTVFGADDSVEKSLDFSREDTPLPGWMNGMASYSMWYVLILYDRLMYTGDYSFIEKQKDYLIGLSGQLSSCIDANGQDCVTKGRFLDWPSNDRPDIIDAGVQALHYMAADRLEKLFIMLGEEEEAKRCSADKKALAGYPVDYKDSKQAAALLVLARLKDAEAANDALLSKGGAQGMSTFMGYYILTARAMAGDYQGCLNCIRQYWGGMLSLGATTFWEDFDVAWMTNAAPIDRLTKEGEVDIHGTYGRYCYKGYRHSLCHGWASGATPWLTEQVLGIRILEPGCKKLGITPHLGDLDWAKGTFPTPYGAVAVMHRKRANGSIETEVNAPKEVAVIVGGN